MPFTFGGDADASNPGDTQAVQCMTIKGDVPITFEWMLNGRRIANNENKITITKVSPRISTLSIESISRSHHGEFKCIASNAAGQSEQSAELFVNGKPTSAVPYASTTMILLFLHFR